MPTPHTANLNTTTRRHHFNKNTIITELQNIDRKTNNQLQEQFVLFSIVVVVAVVVAVLAVEDGPQSEVCSSATSLTVSPSFPTANLQQQQQQVARVTNVCV